MSPIKGKLFAKIKGQGKWEKKKRPVAGAGNRNKAEIPFLSLAGQTVIVNRAVLPTSAPSSSAPSQEKFPVT